MHILFLTDNFPPEANAPANRTFEHCREWARAGQQVTVITCAPNFPTGKVFTGYRNKCWQSEEMEGIRVIRVWTYITANEGFLKRIIDYISFLPSAVLASLPVRRVDLVIGTSPQFFTVCAAYLVSVIKRIPFVFELRDIWPESIKAVGAMNDSWVIRVLERIELFLYRRAARIISVTHSFKTILKQRGIDTGKIEVITNGVDIAHFEQRDKDPGLVAQLALEGGFVCGYVGTHGMAHALEVILDAASMAKENGDPFRFILLGDGARKAVLKRQATAQRLDNVVFVNSVPKSEVARYWSLLDVSIIHLRSTALFTSVIPSKLFECMAMGIPVLHGVAGESAQIVGKEGIGIVFEPENGQELYQGIVRLSKDRKLYNQLRQRCLEAARHYDRGELATRMLEILRNVANRIQLEQREHDK